MNKKAVKEFKVVLPVNYLTLAPGEVEQIMSDLGPYKKLTPDECRELMDTRLGDSNLSEVLVEMRREARY